MMNILVSIKRVVDAYVKIRVRADERGIETQQVKMSMNPFDEIAIEEALRIREKQGGATVTVVTVGEDSSQETLRQALALGADRALLVRTPERHCSLTIAHLLKKVVELEKPTLVLMGKQSIDGDNHQTPQMLAALLDWPQATCVSNLELYADHLLVTRETDAGLETLKVMLPAVVSTDLRLNEPRYATLPNIMKAKQKPLEIIEATTLGVDLKPHIEVLSVKAPKARRGGVKVDSVQALFDKLHLEARVL